MKCVSIFVVFILIIAGSCSKKEAAVKSMEGLEPPQLLEKANKSYAQGNMDDAIEAYEIIYTRYPTSREYISAVLGMARAYNNMGEFERGFSLLYNLIRENMVPSRVPEIYNEMARYYEVTAAYSKEAGISREGEDYQKAIEYYKKAIDYPNSDDAEAKSYAQFQIGELEMKMDNYDQAALAYQSTMYRFSGTEWAQLAEQRMDQMRQEGKTTISPLKKTGTGQSTPKPESKDEEIPGEVESIKKPDKNTDEPE